MTQRRAAICFGVLFLLFFMLILPFNFLFFGADTIFLIIFSSGINFKNVNLRKDLPFSKDLGELHRLVWYNVLGIESNKVKFSEKGMVISKDEKNKNRPKLADENLR